VPAHDLVGRIDALGPDVEGWSVGDRVADLTTIGAYSEYVCLPAARLTRVPDGVADADALAMILSAVTPYQMLHRVAKAQAARACASTARAVRWAA
jgi:NADPH:quinone reductase-like Zn-dependent oxidoreductase